MLLLRRFAVLPAEGFSKRLSFSISTVSRSAMISRLPRNTSPVSPSIEIQSPSPIFCSPSLALRFSASMAAAPVYWMGTKTSILPASLIALASGLSWLLFTAASMAGSFSEALSPDNMTAVMEETQFGRVWTVHLALVAALCILAGRDRRGRRSFAISLTVLSAACLASLAGAGASRPVEFHRQPLLEPYVNLSTHTAPIRQTCRSSQSASARRGSRKLCLVEAGIG